ncbi:hypothetical protein [Polynucleobacter sp. AP-Nino-20-G2]|uniref:hypothetical protein n=1 Tax=Polynucleobacter sp. AP-Nino-20-G2 TaxID=2576917 RepID=UPI001BFE9968|nr:hypothetical protein [Polynucleobacter sp. AP-Nino-20-G2]QWE17291.1 hypothetical protein FD960_03500 [Polynucleobacter sp. AP-Nino-20-G2]
MKSSLTAGSKFRYIAEPGLSTNIRIVFSDGTVITTTLAPGLDLQIVAGTSNSLEFYIDKVFGGNISPVD